MTSDEKDPVEAKTNTNSRQNDELYTAGDILDPRKRRAEKKRMKVNKLNSLNQMDADYDSMVDYRMKYAPSDVNTADNVDNSDSGDDEATEEVSMAGAEMDA